MVHIYIFGPLLFIKFMEAITFNQGVVFFSLFFLLTWIFSRAYRKHERNRDEELEEWLKRNEEVFDSNYFREVWLEVKQKHNTKSNTKA